MNKREFIEAIKDLNIEIEFDDAGNAPWAGSHKLVVKLLYDGEVISESMTYLPNESRSSEY